MNWETDCRVGGAPPEPWGPGTATLRPLQLTGAAGASAVVIRFRCSKKGRSAPPVLYKVIILYFKCVLKRKQRSNAPLNISYSLCNHGNVCVWACVLHGYVCICSCAFKSAMTYREPFWVALLPNVILFLLALLIL